MKIKITIIFLFLFFLNSFSQNNEGGKIAQGVFFSASVGPRIPLGLAGTEQATGFGFNGYLWYTNNEILPIIITSRIGYEHYTGSQSFLKQSKVYSSILKNLYPFSLGVKYFLPPILKNEFILLPYIEAGGLYAFESKVLLYKTNPDIANTETYNRFGYTIGAGISMVLFELQVSYNYLPVSQNISLDLKVSIPLYVSF